MRMVIFILVCGVLLAAGVVIAARWFGNDLPALFPATGSVASRTSGLPPGGPEGRPAAGNGGDARITQLCSSCHMLPPADVEPKGLWPQKIEHMYEYARIMRQTESQGLPPIDDVIAYWTARAPEHLDLPADALGSPPSPLAFGRRKVKLPGLPSPASISHVQFVRLSEDGPMQILICDMRHGLVALWTPPHEDDSAVRIIGRVAHPSRARVVDLDGDGLLDVLVANLGDFWPVDTDRGSLVWLRNLGQGKFENIVLAEGLGRVNDVQAADFDGDGDLDLVVAVFGNLTTGMILYLENFTEDDAQPDFEAISLDGHTGTSDVWTVDLNGDGRLDFLALQSQQHERVVAFLNATRGRFRSELVYAAPHPRWGSTGIVPFDLDGDGDLDILFNHGDSVQVPPIPRPYHGISWLENQGGFPFVYHRLAHLPGAHTLLPADLDGDGNLDLVSSVFIPAFDPAWPNAGQLDSVVWLQQIAPGQYTRYSLATGAPFHPCLALGDYDGDGDVDIVLGNFFMFPAGGAAWTACLTVLENSQADAPVSRQAASDGPSAAAPGR